MFLSPASSFLIKVLLGIVLLPNSFAGPTLCKSLHKVGPYRLLGSGKIPKSKLIRKLEAGDRNIYREYIAFCNYKGKRHAMLLKRRKAEFALLYIP